MERASIHLAQLALTLVGAMALFVLGIQFNPLTRSTQCFVIAIFIQFLLLSAFAWLLLSSWHSRQAVRNLFIYRSTRQTFAHFTGFGYGCPAVITCITLIITHGGYDQQDLCWVSSSSGILWSLAGPICALSALFYLVEIDVLRHIYWILPSRTAVVGGRQQQQASRFRRRAVILSLNANSCLAVVMGITWLFAFLAIGGSGSAMNNVFTVFASI